MFNVTSYSQDVSFNSVSGTLVKSCAESKFVRFHQKSDMAEKAFGESPMIYRKKVEIIQIMLCGGDQFLVEYRQMQEET